MASVSISGFIDRDITASTEVASYSTTSSYADAAAVTLAIPSHWNGWECEAYATARLAPIGGSTWFTNLRIRIDGTDQQALESLSNETGEQTAVAVGGRRTGMTTTGSRTVSLRAQRTNDATGLYDIYLFARAVRTS